MGVGGGALGMSDVLSTGVPVSEEEEEASSSQELIIGAEVGLVCCFGLDIESFWREESRPVMVRRVAVVERVRSSLPFVLFGEDGIVVFAAITSSGEGNSWDGKVI